VEIRGSFFKVSLGKKLVRLNLKQQVRHTPVIPGTWEALGRRFAVSGQTRTKRKANLKNN
jgi:hypothetical protein